MNYKHKEFINEALKQLKSIFEVEGTAYPNNKELIMTTYMHMIAYAYDDRERIDKTDEEMLEIAKKSTKQDTPNSNTGRVLRCKPCDAKRLNLLKEDSTEEGRKKWSTEFSSIEILKDNFFMLK